MVQRVTPKVWTVMLLIAGVVAVWFLWPQLSVVIFTALMAFIFYPLYKRFKRKKGGAAAVLTLVASFLVVLLPLAFVVIASVGQLMHFADEASRSGYWENVPALFGDVIQTANTIMEPITGERPSVTEQGVVDFLRTSLPAFARTSVQVVLGVLGSLPQLGIALLIYIFLFVDLLRKGPWYLKKLQAISPFGPDATKRYFARIGLMANAMVKGQLIIAMVISAIAAALLMPLGYGQYFFILFMLFTVLNFIPLGSGIVMVPLVLYSMFTGHFWLGLVVIVVYYAAGNLDPLLRTKLIPKEIQLSVALTMVATFCGIAYFGILGVVYGPIIMIILTTTVQLYSEQKSILEHS